MEIIRVTALPNINQLKPNSVYLVKSGDDVDIYVTGATKELIAGNKQSTAIKKGSNDGATVSDITVNAFNQDMFDNEDSYAFDLANGNYQKFEPEIDGTISFTGFTNNKLCQLMVKAIGLGDHVVTWPQEILWVRADGSYTDDYSQSGVYFNIDSGVDFIMFWSDDGGDTVYAKVFR